MLYSVTRNRALLTRKFVTRWNPLFGGGSSFLPSQIDNMLFWYDASTISTLFQDSAKTIPVSANNDPVGAWICKASIGPDLLQATTANKPTYKTNIQNSLPGIYFITDDWLDTTVGSLGQPKTFIVAYNNYGSSSPIIAHETLARSVERDGLNSVRWVATSITAPAEVHGTHVLTLYQDPTNKNVKLDSVAGTPAANTAQVQMDWVGHNIGGEYLDGTLLEMVGYSVTPDTGDIALVENYLNAKWSIY